MNLLPLPPVSRQIRSWRRAVLNLTLMHGIHYLVGAKGPPVPLSHYPLKGKGVHLLSPSRTGAGAAQNRPEDLHCQDDEHQELVEKHRGAVRQLVSLTLLPNTHTHSHPKLMLPVFSSGYLSVFAV